MGHGGNDDAARGLPREYGFAITSPEFSMRRTVSCLLIGLASPFAFAQTPPMPDMAERMQSMPAEQRKRMESMMKQRGIDTRDGAMRICMTRETLDQGHWRDGGSAKCKTDVTEKSGTAWKWRSVCTQPPVTSDGEALFQDPEHYTVSIRSTMTLQGQPRESTMVSKARWVGADCGDVKPIAPRQR
jgi:hypothetical protein